jgi:hypothetical protein
VVGGLISLFFVMFRLMFMAVRMMLIATVWMVQVSVVLIASLAGGGSPTRLPRLRL